MKTSAFALACFLALSGAQALTLQGTVQGGAALPTSARLSVWSEGASGSASAELTSVPINGGTFSLPLLDTAPISRVQYPLRPESIGWPGVIGDVRVSAPVQVSDLGFYVYGDTNGNGRRDANEALLDAFPEVDRQPVVTVWVSGDVKISGGRGFELALRSGWNTFTVELGRVANVGAYKGQSINLRVQR
jgi:hypothetical protein